jgi:hypothetical protein
MQTGPEAQKSCPEGWYPIHVSPTCTAEGPAMQPALSYTMGPQDLLGYRAAGRIGTDPGLFQTIPPCFRLLHPQYTLLLFLRTTEEKGKGPLECIIL